MSGKTKGDMEAALAVGAYMICSMSMNLGNKAILSSFEFKAPFLLGAFQTATTTLILFALATVSPNWKRSLPALNMSTAIAWTPAALLFASMLTTGALATRYLPIHMLTIFKNLTNILTAYGDWHLYGNKVSPPILGALGLMVLSSIIAGATDMAFNAVGYFWMAVNCIITAAYALYIRGALKTLGLDSTGAVFYNNLLSVPLMTLAGLGLGEVSWLPEFQYASDGSFQFLMVLSAGLSFFMAFSSFMLVKATSSTTYAMTGSFTKIPTAVLGMIAFSTPVTWTNVASVFAGLAAGLLYSWAKLQDKLAKQKEDEAAALLAEKPWADRMAAMSGSGANGSGDDGAAVLGNGDSFHGHGNGRVVRV